MITRWIREGKTVAVGRLPLFGQLQKLEELLLMVTSNGQMATFLDGTTHELQNFN